MTPYEFAQTINDLPVDQQNHFFEVLKDQLSDKDWLTTVKFISLHGLFTNPEKYTALKNAVCDTLKEAIYSGI